MLILRGRCSGLTRFDQFQESLGHCAKHAETAAQQDSWAGLLERPPLQRLGRRATNTC